MGFTAVVRDLPQLMRRIGQTARASSRPSPDCLVTIDSPDFSLRVARKVRAASAGDPDRPLCLPERLGMAPERARRPCSRMSTMCLPAALRARGDCSASAVRPAPLSATG